MSVHYELNDQCIALRSNLLAAGKNKITDVSLVALIRNVTDTLKKKSENTTFIDYSKLSCDPEIEVQKMCQGYQNWCECVSLTVVIKQHVRNITYTASERTPKLRRFLSRTHISYLS